MSASALNRLRFAIGGVCGMLVLGLMLITVIDVIGRYILARPLPGASEMTELALAVLIYAGLPAVCLDDGHISVEMLVDNMPDRVKTLHLLCMRLLVSGLLGFVAWRLALHGTRLSSYGEITVFLGVAVGPLAWLMAALTAFAALLTLALAVYGSAKGADGADDPLRGQVG